MKVKDFIDHVISGDLDLYLFDWSLPHHCPPLAEELTIPKYFAGVLLFNVSLILSSVFEIDSSFS